MKYAAEFVVAVVAASAVLVVLVVRGCGDWHGRTERRPVKEHRAFVPLVQFPYEAYKSHSHHCMH